MCEYHTEAMQSCVFHYYHSEERALQHVWCGHGDTAYIIATTCKSTKTDFDDYIVSTSNRLNIIKKNNMTNGIHVIQATAI